jgi:hypothetical protein
MPSASLKRRTAVDVRKPEGTKPAASSGRATATNVAASAATPRSAASATSHASRRTRPSSVRFTVPTASAAHGPPMNDASKVGLWREQLRRRGARRQRRLEERGRAGRSGLAHGRECTPSAAKTRSGGKGGKGPTLSEIASSPATKFGTSEPSLVRWVAGAVVEPPGRPGEQRTSSPDGDIVTLYGRPSYLPAFGAAVG